MAQGSAKKIHSENKRTLKFILLGNIVTIGIYLVASWFFERDMTIWIPISLSLEWICFLFMRSWGASTFHSDGKLESCGMDLNSPTNHVIQYMMDYIYITWFVHCISPMWSKAWWIYLSIPIYAFVKIATLVRAYTRASQPVRSEYIPKNNNKH